jgi:pimeloyl-ACP methyl ester carboxylesterase
MTSILLLPDSVSLLTRSRSLVLLGFALTALSATAQTSSPTNDPFPAPEIPVLAWQPCAATRQSGFECATAQVPLDYKDPDGAAIHIAVIKHPATDPPRRIGSLFFNPGGPGGAGTEDLPNWFSHFPVDLRARFDIISFDPRGIGDSTAVQCFANLGEESEFLAKLPQRFPVGPVEVKRWIRGYAEFDRRCRERNGELLAHVSTAEVARDLDLLRQAVGEDQMNFIGASYGTFLGAVYSNLFPDKIRAMVLDGNINPIAWTRPAIAVLPLGTTLRLRSDVVASRSLKAFIDQCGQATTQNCAFSAESAEATEDKLTLLLKRLQTGRVVFNGKTVTYAALVGGLGDAQTFTRGFQTPGFPLTPGWRENAATIQEVWLASEQSNSAAAQGADSVGDLQTPKSNPATNHEKYSGPEQLFAVYCAESPNPRDPQVFLFLAAFSSARAGVVGPYYAWGDEACAQWPAVAAERYSGPWNNWTANPILVIGNTFDPSTAYASSIIMAKLLARARLLTVDGYGHTVLLNPSACASQFESDYFIEGTLPPQGTVCQQDKLPFDPEPEF